MKEYMNENPMTTLMFAIFGLVALVGGALVLFDSAGNLSYEDYLDNLTKFALAVGILGAGKAIKKGLGGEEGIPLDDGSGPEENELRGEYPEDAPVDEGPRPEGTVGGFGEHGQPSSEGARASFRETGRSPKS